MTDLKDFNAMAEELQEKDPETYNTVIRIMRTTLGEIAERERLREAAKRAEGGHPVYVKEHERLLRLKG